MSTAPHLNLRARSPSGLPARWATYQIRHALDSSRQDLAWHTMEVTDP